MNLVVVVLNLDRLKHFGLIQSARSAKRRAKEEDTGGRLIDAGPFVVRPLRVHDGLDNVKIRARSLPRDKDLEDHQSTETMRDEHQRPKRIILEVDQHVEG